MAEPRYRTILSDLLKAIRTGELKDGDRLPAESELQSRYAVSRITAGRAIQELQSLGLVYRVRGSGTFVRQPTPLTTGPQSGPTTRPRFIAAIFPQVERNGIPQILGGIEQASQGHDYLVTFHNSQNDPGLEAELIRRLVDQGCSGLILYPCYTPLVNARLYSELSLAGFPLVMVDRSIDFLNLPLVACDNRQSMRELTQAVIARGHRRIAFICNSIEAISSEQERFCGYGEALLAAGLAVDTNLVWRCAPGLGIGDSTGLPDQNERFRQVSLAIERLMGLVEPPDCIMAVNDILAISILKAAQAKGLAVPRDLAITGFDDMEAAQHLDVSLTTVAQPFRQIGQDAARLLLSQMAMPPPNVAASTTALEKITALRIKGGLRLRESM